MNIKLKYLDATKLRKFLNQDTIFVRQENLIIYCMILVICHKFGQDVSFFVITSELFVLKKKARLFHNQHFSKAINPPEKVNSKNSLNSASRGYFPYNLSGKETFLLLALG